MYWTPYFFVYFLIRNSAYLFLNYFFSNFKLFNCLLRTDWWYTLSIINSIIRMYLATALASHILWWWGKFFINSINITLLLFINKFLFLNIFYFIFLQNFLLINSVPLSIELWTVGFSMIRSFLFSSFWGLWFLIL